jgi:RNA polymerase sigma-70 factor (ECF subfamily)
VDHETEQLIAKLRAGDQEAACQLFGRYVGPLIKLAQARLSPGLARRVDAEDIVQSAMASFVQRAREGRFEFQEAGDLWRLLVVMTLNKLRRRAEYEGAEKRGYQQERSAVGGLSDGDYEAAARVPTPEAAAMLGELVEQLTAGLDDVQQQMVHMRLQGYELEEIADHVSRSERTVRRVLDRVKQRLESAMALEER